MCIVFFEKHSPTENRIVQSKLRYTKLERLFTIKLKVEIYDLEVLALDVFDSAPRDGRNIDKLFRKFISL